MQQHPHFELWLHDDELAAILGSPVTQRTTIHEWPLSCVQRIHHAAKTCVYKVQAEPTVEPTFYQNAGSPLVVGAQMIPCGGKPAALLLEDVSAPDLSKLAFSTPTNLAIVDTLLTQIGQIEGNLPAIADLRTPEKWCIYGQEIIQSLQTLVEDGTLHEVDTSAIDCIAAHVESPTVLDAFDGEIGYVHTDLTAENVLVLSDGYRVLDWQRPIWGPTALDRATLLESLGFDAVHYIQRSVCQLRILLQIGWFTQMAKKWFPAGAATYDKEIGRLINQLET